jgi:hypothetical protein
MAKKYLTQLIDAAPTADDYVIAGSEHALHRAETIMAVSFLEDALKAMICSRLVPLSAEEKAGLFGPQSSMGTFSAKIAFGFALGIYGKITRDDLGTLRQIRNVFAHSRKNVSFNTPAIRQAALSLRLFSNVPRGHPILAFALSREPKEPKQRCGMIIHMLLAFFAQQAQKPKKADAALLLP